jgi:hypothetical protein
MQRKLPPACENVQTDADYSREVGFSHLLTDQVLTGRIGRITPWRSRARSPAPKCRAELSGAGAQRPTVHNLDFRVLSGLPVNRRERCADEVAVGTIIADRRIRDNPLISFEAMEPTLGASCSESSASMPSGMKLNVRGVCLVLKLAEREQPEGRAALGVCLPCELASELAYREQLLARKSWRG